MNKEIQALDLAITRLQEEKAKAIKKAMDEKKEKKEKAEKKITPKDKTLIKELIKLAEWWRKKGPNIEKTIKVTIKANLLWTEDKEPYVDGYEILYNGGSIDFDELIRGDLFEEDLEKYQKQINSICDSANKLDKKYPNAKIIYDIFT